MKISIPTNHHYYESSFFDENRLWDEFALKTKKDKKALEDQLFSNVYSLTTKNQEFSQLEIIGFKDRRNKLEDEEQLVLKLFAQKNQEGRLFAIQTGLFAGVIHHNGYTFNIQTRYGNVLLHRMLNFVNDIYVDTKDVSAISNKQSNEFQYIIAYLFIQSLEKASVLGLPKQYTQVTERSSKVRGKISINEYLKTDIPFQGKLTSTYRTQKYIQEIVDVLFAATNKVGEYLGGNYKSKIIGVYQMLNEHHSKSYISRVVLEKAKNHIVLYSPLYKPFAEVLKYAEILLKNQDIQADESGRQYKTYGFMFDISQLFEVYLEKLLSRHFTDWTINGQEELKVYNHQFFGRRMFPDIVMKHKQTQEVIVFDAKFKKMIGRKDDLDRSDFYQIHTYMQYYMPNIIFGGLIYPLSKELSKEDSVSKGLFGNTINTPNFIVDGIYINQQMDMTALIESEQKFLKRLNLHIDNCRTTHKQKVN
jgi:5-methylcytosine-specific restriction endonuclease McrBC regulatory subunit McrC